MSAKAARSTGRRTAFPVREVSSADCERRKYPRRLLHMALLTSRTDTGTFLYLLDYLNEVRTGRSYRPIVPD